MQSTKTGKCARCNKPKKEWVEEGLKVENVEYCCLGCADDTGCTCPNNQYDFDNSDT